MSDDAFETWIKWELARPFLYLESLAYIRDHPAGDFTSWESELISALSRVASRVARALRGNTGIPAQCGVSWGYKPAIPQEACARGRQHP